MVRSRLVRLSALGLLATVLTILSTAVAASATAVPGTGGPAFAAASTGPSATAVRSDPRVPALRGGPGAGDLDLLGGYRQPHRLPDPVAGRPVPASASGAARAGDARRYQGRAPPHTR
jgi:hypothetical protein